MASPADQLRVVLADIVTFKFLAHGDHWNVEGVDFSAYHALFGSIYEFADGQIDMIAEDIRKCGEYAPFLLRSYVELTTIDVEDVDTDPQSMCALLVDAIESVISTVGDAFEAAVEADEQGIANDMAGLDGELKKWRWQLRASLKGASDDDDH